MCLISLNLNLQRRSTNQAVDGGEPNWGDIGTNGVRIGLSQGLGSWWHCHIIISAAPPSREMQVFLKRWTYSYYYCAPIPETASSSSHPQQQVVLLLVASLQSISLMSGILYRYIGTSIVYHIDNISICKHLFLFHYSSCPASDDEWNRSPGKAFITNDCSIHSCTSFLKWHPV